MLAANEVIQNNLKRKPKNLWTENQEGNKIQYFRADSEQGEAHFVAGKIKELVKVANISNPIWLFYIVPMPSPG